MFCMCFEMICLTATIDFPNARFSLPSSHSRSPSLRSVSSPTRVSEACSRCQMLVKYVPFECSRVRLCVDCYALEIVLFLYFVFYEYNNSIINKTPEQKHLWSKSCEKYFKNNGKKFNEKGREWSKKCKTLQ